MPLQSEQTLGTKLNIDDESYRAQQRERPGYVWLLEPYGV
jgi:hypothetical protein